MTNSVQQKISNFVLEFPQYEGISIEKLVSIMLETGYVSLRELREVSAFGINVKKDINKGVAVERASLTDNAEVVEGYEYETEDGVKIKEIYNGKELVERIIYKKDEAGNEKRTNFYYTDGVLSKRVKAENGNVITTSEYSYIPGGEDGVDIVTLTSKKRDGSLEVVNAIEINESGDVKEEDFLDRTITYLNGVQKNIYKENGFLYEKTVNPDKSMFLSIYNGSSLDAYENKQLHKYFSEYDNGKRKNSVEYDGQGNTFIVVQNGEGFEHIAKRFGCSVDEIIALNSGLEKNSILQVGQKLLVPGEASADDVIFKKRLDEAGAFQAYINDESTRLQTSLYASKVAKSTLDKDYAGVYDFTRESLAKQGIMKPTVEQLNTRKNELLMLNGEIQYKKGAKVFDVVKTADSKSVAMLTELGFKPCVENIGFYSKFNDLNEEDKKTFLESLSNAVLKYKELAAEWRWGYIPKDYIDKAYVLNFVNVCTNIDLAGEDDKFIPTTKYYDVIRAKHNYAYNGENLSACFNFLDRVSIESFVKHCLKLEGSQADDLINRLRSLSPQALQKIDIENYTSSTAVNSDILLGVLLNKFAANGVELRTPEEIYLEQIRPRTPREISIMRKKMAIKCVENAFDNAIAIIKKYQDSQGVWNVGYWREKLGKLVDKTELLGDVAASFSKVIERIESQKATVCLQLSCAVERSDFEEKYREFMGVEYDEEKFIKLFDAIEAQSGNVQELFESAVGTRYLEYAKDRVEDQQIFDGLGDVAAMIITLNVSAEFKLLQSFVKGAPAVVGKVVTNPKVAGVLGRGFASGTMLSGYTALTGTVNLLTNAQQETSEDWKGLGVATAGSFGFGFVGGALANQFHAVNKSVSNFASRCLPKVFVNNQSLDAVKNILPKFGKSMSGAEFMEKYLANSVKGNIVGDAAQFVTEVLAFSGYEIGVDVASDITKYLFDENGEFRSHLDEQSITDYLMEKVGAQVEMLGSIKGVSAFLQMVMGGKLHGSVVMSEKLNEIEVLRNIKIRDVNVNGVRKYVLENGKERFVIDNLADIPLLFQNIIAIHSLNKLYEQKIADVEKSDKVFDNKNSEAENSLSTKPSEKVHVEAETLSDAIIKNTELINNFDLKPETFKEFLLGLKAPDGTDLIKSEVLEKRFSTLRADDIALRYELVEKVVKEMKMNSSTCLDAIEHIFYDLSTSEAKILNRLLDVSPAKQENLIDCNILIAGYKFDSRVAKTVESLLDIAEETNHPLLNRDNIIYLSESIISFDIELLVKALKVKDVNGNFILDNNLIRILETQEKALGLLEKVVELEGKVDGQVFKEFAPMIWECENVSLGNYLLKSVLDKRLTKPEQINEFVEEYFNYPSELDISFNELLKNKGLWDYCSPEKLSQLVQLVDAYVSLKGFGEVVKNGDVMSYYEQLKKSNPELATQLEIEGAYYKQDGSNFEKASPELRDIIESSRVERLKKVFELKNIDSEIKNFLYEEYLNTFPCEDVYKNKCREINEKYGVKVIMGAYKEVEALDFVREELQAFRDASGGTVKLIDVFDFTMSSYADYVNPKGAYGTGTAGGYQTTHIIGTKSMRFSSVAHALRHELMHANDLKSGFGIDPKYNWDEIAVKKRNGKFDLSKCKYVDDFRRIGIPEGHISYAYNNTKEFIAVAAEGDLTRCTPEFKQVLIDFGMPEWMFRIRSHEAAKAQAGASFMTLCEPVGEAWGITSFGQWIIETQVEQLRTTAAKNLYDNIQFIYDFALGQPRNLTYRTKSSTSMFDKVKNHLYNNAKKAPSLADAMLDVRDSNGFRTTIENVDYSSHPEVKSLLDAGDKHGAALRAAELQSQPYVDRLIGVMNAFAAGRTNKKPVRVSNYTGVDGIPYFSERQLKEIQICAQKCNINLSIVTEFDVKNNSHFSEQELKAYKKTRTTQERVSGYTALQVNFENGDGTVFEWQLRGKEVDYFAEREHLPYDLRMNKDVSAGNSELKILLTDIKDLLKEDNINPQDYAEYNRYLTAHYRHLRHVELGIQSEAPKLPEKFDSRLKVENLDLLHDYMVKVKEGEMTGAEALAEYMQKLR